jgi:multicomponent Na+:H+ antiporter subunit C
VSIFPYLVATWIVLIGCYGIVSSRNIIHTVVCLGIVQSGTYLFLVAVGFRQHASAPIISTQVKTGSPLVDPVVQAMTLTDVVVSATGYAILLALVLQVTKSAGTLDPNEVRELRG